MIELHPTTIKAAATEIMMAAEQNSTAKMLGRMRKENDELRAALEAAEAENERLRAKLEEGR
jgi:predicted RNase H-like nuclease (RuvC/YqgF family)